MIHCRCNETLSHAPIETEMANFLARVELHGASSQDYENLHAAMEQAGFSRRIQSSDGVWYHLPTAEYYCSTTTAATDRIRDVAAQAAGTTGRRAGVLVAEAGAMFWIGLDRV